MNIIGVVLAAGAGKRMNSSLPKVAHLLLGKALIIWAIESLLAAKIKQIVVVIAPSQKIVEDIISQYPFPKGTEIHFAYQDPPLGTGHAVQCALKGVENYFAPQLSKDLNILVSYGDTPAVQGATFQRFFKFHLKEKNAFTILAFESKNPFGYGRILRDANNNFVAIREEKDCSTEEKQVTLCNSGVLCGQYVALKEILPQLKNENAAKEFYLTDVPTLAKNSGKKVAFLVGAEEAELLGVNSQEQLQALASKIAPKH